MRTKIRERRGITLISLVITIIILLILAGVTVTSIINGGLIDKARQAKEEYGQAKIDEEAALDELSEKIDGYIQKSFAKIVEENPAEYYGKVVSNYTVGDNTYQDILDTEGIEWKIFHSDGDNIYLIASDYIPYSACPAGKNGTAITKGSTYRLGVNNVINDYAGSADVKEISLKVLNSDYFNKNYTSTNINMKAVAYMIDTSAKVWGKYANNSYADYAIAGPTLEMFLDSYNKKHPEANNKYQAQATNAIGYKVSVDSGVNWDVYMSGSVEALDSTDSLYVINRDSNAYYTWLASPSAGATGYMMVVSYDGRVYINGSDNSDAGFRPVVCLKSNVNLTAEENDRYTIGLQ